VTNIRASATPRKSARRRRRRRRRPKRRGANWAERRRPTPCYSNRAARRERGRGGPCFARRSPAGEDGRLRAAPAMGSGGGGAGATGGSERGKGKGERGKRTVAVAAARAVGRGRATAATQADGGRAAATGISMPGQLGLAAVGGTAGQSAHHTTAQLSSAQAAELEQGGGLPASPAGTSWHGKSV
jgi:hypothetical protein